MEYDDDEDKWYIEVTKGNWQPLTDNQYEEFKDRLWHIDWEFVKIE